MEPKERHICIYASVNWVNIVQIKAKKIYIHENAFETIVCEMAAMGQ